MKRSTRSDKCLEFGLGSFWGMNTWLDTTGGPWFDLLTSKFNYEKQQRKEKKKT